ncbi:hypothetical protein D0T53_01925 [Dysgonomonas sp. 216]|uniref:hypothetical protein n=1 Tax=Dysgonomonas sp. 216 TaxID=2302934 RepID=UPI0013D5F626|nr:hypothetical protein [Dysgonomonas sp. 216]NDW17673.1 hypothetical protein [Dysgonomonas sp. 216]
MTQLEQKVKKFSDVMADDSSSNDDVSAALRQIYQLIPDAGDEDFNKALKSIFSLVKLPNIDRAAMAASICGYLVENGYPGDVIVGDFIELYDSLLDSSAPFFEAYYKRIEGFDKSDDETEEKTNEIFQNLWQERLESAPQEIGAVVCLDKFFPCGISLFSADRKAFSSGKEKLNTKVSAFAEANQGCYWFDKLFTVLFDEPVVVIDMDTNRGFTGKMSGIVDNFQLQLVLMGINGFNDEVNINDEDLDIIHGFGSQSSESVVEGKWNMYDCHLIGKGGWEELINNKKASVDKARDFMDTWIWSEGSPADIPVKNGHRVILLGQPSYIRNLSIQRTFKNLEAYVEIEKKLTSEEIAEFLK